MPFAYVGAAAAVGSFANNLANSAGGLPGPSSQAAGIASDLNSQGQQLGSYLFSGKLPPGVQAGLDQGEAAQEAGTRSMYAARGMSGSSSQVTDLGNEKIQEKYVGAQLAEKLLEVGIGEQEDAANIYNQQVADAITQDGQLGNALGNLGSALGELNTGAGGDTSGSDPNFAGGNQPLTDTSNVTAGFVSPDTSSAYYVPDIPTI